MRRDVHTLDAQGLPPPGLEFQLANELLGKDSPLLRNLLTELMGRPRRYSELKFLLHGKPENNLTYAVKKLLEEGLIRQQVDARLKKPLYRYQLSFLGIQVILKMEQLKFAQTVADLGSLLQNPNVVAELANAARSRISGQSKLAHGG